MSKALHFADELVDRFRGHRARQRPEQQAIPQYHQSGNRSDLECRRETGLGLGVDLSEPDIGVARRCGLEYRRERATRPTPRGPEIEEDNPLL